MADAEQNFRLQIGLTTQELRAIDQRRFAKHIPSRAATVRDLIRRGLVAEDLPPSPVRTVAVRKLSSEFSVGTLSVALTVEIETVVVGGQSSPHGQRDGLVRPGGSLAAVLTVDAVPLLRP